MFEEFVTGQKLAIISDIVYDELSDSPIYVRNKLEEIPINNLEKLDKNSESVFLADKYVEFKVISEKYYNDALHIALATFNEADALISWNFKHMVKLKTIRGVNGVNRMLGFKELEILTPQSLIQEGNNE